jgi:hypothetical protein
MKKNILLFLVFLFFVSCDTNERNIKKAYKRLNVGETASASKYIWPEDHKNLYTFQKRFFANNELMTIDVESIDKLNFVENEAYEVTFKCNNCSDELKAYFESKNNLLSDSKVVDTIFAKSANGTPYITFDWDLNDDSISENLKLSTILTEKLNLRTGPSTQFEVVGQLESGDELLIDDSYDNSSWRKGIFFDDANKLKEVYFSSKLSDRIEISFFSLNWSDSMGILVISILAIIVLFVVYPLLFAALFRAGGEGAGIFALILFGVLLIAVYFTYQIIETAVFELFLINLPF